MYSAMLMDTFQDSDTRFPIRYSFDGKSFNPRRLKAKPKVQPDVLDELLYTDDMDKNACSEGPWIKFHSHVMTMILQSAQKRQRLYTNQLLENEQ